MGSWNYFISSVIQNGTVVKNAWRLSSKQTNTSCLFQTKSSDQRDKWIGYFLQERKIVYETTSGETNSLFLIFLSCTVLKLQPRPYYSGRWAQTAINQRLIQSSGGGLFRLMRLPKPGMSSVQCQSSQSWKYACASELCSWFVCTCSHMIHTTLANSIPLEDRLAAMDEAKYSVKSRKQVGKYWWSLVTAMYAQSIW